MEIIKAKTQAELDAALLATADRIACVGDGWFTIRGSAHVEAWGSAHVVAWESAHVEATNCVAIHIYGTHCQVAGGVQIKVPEIRTGKEWCEWYGVAIKDGIAQLYKAVDDHYISSRGFAYTPGSEPVAPDWDGGVAECGGGLHFAPTVGHALGFKYDATRFVRCPVRVSDIVVHCPAQYPHKIKARGVCGPVVEVDRSGKPMITLALTNRK